VTALHTYAYLRPSSLSPAEGLDLETSGGTALRGPSGPTAHPRFFSGFLTHPAAAAAGLLAVAEVARTRYFQPAETGFRDPVVTSDGERLRLESFSACGGVYARLDVLGAGLDGEVLDRGTTNVDVNEPLRRALTGVLDRSPLHVAVGPGDVTVTTQTDALVERKVPLPERWLRGFAEVQVVTGGFDPRAELDAGEAVRFLRGLPAQARAGGALWVLPAGRSLRLTSRPAPGAVCLPGPQRLSALVPLLRFVTGLRVYGPPVSAGDLPVASAWELGLPGMRLTVALSPEVTRGFSGEGGVLDALAAESVADDADLVAALLAFEPRIEVDMLAERSGLDDERVRRALVQLGTSGRVGRDLAEAAYFHRELPYDLDAVERLNPRLAGARALVAAGAVRVEESRGDDAVALVRSGDSAHRVRLHEGRRSCTCPWYAKHQGTRGACKHVLAVELATRPDAPRDAHRGEEA
jgi:hypothetical protein